MWTERDLAGQRAWSIMLADVVALLLTFFVLGLSMRELDGGPPTTLLPINPDRPVIALVTQGSVAERATPEISPEADRSFAYLAALLRAQGGLATQASIRYNIFQLSIEMADPTSSASSAERSALIELMATYAFLARRFALEASFHLPTLTDETLAARLGRVDDFRRRLVRELGLAEAEVTVAAGKPDGDPLRLTLRTRSPPSAAAASAPP